MVVAMNLPEVQGLTAKREYHGWRMRCEQCSNVLIRAATSMVINRVEQFT